MRSSTDYGSAICRRIPTKRAGRLLRGVATATLPWLAATALGLSLIADAGNAAMALTLTSSAFKNGEAMPSQYTCEGGDVSPPLAWDGVPDGTKSFALILDDPDAPDPKAPKIIWVHWLVYNLAAATRELAAGAAASGLPQGAATGINNFKHDRYGGPCPPVGRHRYFHKLYALDTTLSLRSPTKPELEAAMQGHVLASAELVGTYQKGDK
jgi:Raf kinase inhibitor-like YbhB/YbcL family protein